MRRAAPLMIALAAALLSSAARSQVDPACANIEAPLAYNACLAAHGPKATNVGPHPAAPSVQSAAAPRHAVRPRAAPARRRYNAYAPRRRGRAHAEFRVR